LTAFTEYDFKKAALAEPMPPFSFFSGSVVFSLLFRRPAVLRHQSGFEAEPRQHVGLQNKPDRDNRNYCKDFFHNDL
jgi:hypothetical protein